jgi:hydroxymethylbilane synthase
MIVNVGTRKSDLALVQTHFVVAELERLQQSFSTASSDDVKFNVISMTTTGDENLTRPLRMLESKSLFTKELEVALLNKSVDFVVHSLKDLPTTLPDGLCIGAILKRAVPNDAIVMSKKNAGKGLRSLDDLTEGSVIGTSSVRRIAQLKMMYPTLVFKDIRGNLNTRLKKLDDTVEGYDAIVLAHAGLSRLGWMDRVSHVLPSSGDHACMYAVGQGALALECRIGDVEILQLVSKLQDHQTLMEVTAERAVMRLLEGGCSVPIGVSCSWESNILTLHALVCGTEANPVKLTTLQILQVITFDEAEKIGAMAAQGLLDKGARKVLDDCRSH